MVGHVDLQESDGDVLICFGVRQGGPTPCDPGVIVEGEIDWRSIGGDDTQGSWTAGLVWVVGDYLDGTLTLTERPSLEPPTKAREPKTKPDGPPVPEVDLHRAREAILAAFNDEFEAGLLTAAPRWNKLTDEGAHGQLEVWLMAEDPELQRAIAEVAAAEMPVESLHFVPKLVIAD